VTIKIIAESSDLCLSQIILNSSLVSTALSLSLSLPRPLRSLSFALDSSFSFLFDRIFSFFSKSFLFHSHSFSPKDSPLDGRRVSSWESHRGRSWPTPFHPSGDRQISLLSASDGPEKRRRRERGRRDTFGGNPREMYVWFVTFFYWVTTLQFSSFLSLPHTFTHFPIHFTNAFSPSHSHMNRPTQVLWRHHGVSAEMFDRQKQIRQRSGKGSLPSLMGILAASHGEERRANELRREKESESSHHSFLFSTPLSHTRLFLLFLFLIVVVTFSTG